MSGVSTTTSPEPTVGQVIAGRYRVERLLGEGGFASVYLARHVELDTPVALKRMHPQHLTRDDLQSRFRSEARTAATLESRHTVRVRDFGFDESGAPFMVMDLVRGPTLETVLESRGPLDDVTVARIALGVLASLSEAAEHGVIHRDIKPANIFLAEDRESGSLVAKVGDFGIAKLINSGEANATRTIDGVLCTPQYAAPEMLLRAPAPASDLYSLGHVLAELLDGRAPYESDNAILSASMHLSSEVVPLGERTRSSLLEDVVARAVSKSLDVRYASAREMSDAVKAACVDAGVEPTAVIGPDEFAAAAVGGTSVKAAPQTRAVGAPRHTPTVARGAQVGTGGRPAPTSQVTTSFDWEEPEEKQRRPLALWVGVGVAAVAAIGILFAALRPSAPEAPEVVSAPIEMPPVAPAVAAPVPVTPPVAAPIVPPTPPAPDLALAAPAGDGSGALEAPPVEPVPPVAEPVAAPAAARARTTERPRTVERRVAPAERREPTPAPAAVPRVEPEPAPAPAAPTPAPARPAIRVGTPIDVPNENR